MNVDNKRKQSKDRGFIVLRNASANTSSKETAGYLSLISLIDKGEILNLQTKRGTSKNTNLQNRIKEQISKYQSFEFQ